MTFKAIIHKAEEGGFWAEIPAVPGCVSQGETLEELRLNLEDAVRGCLSVDLESILLEDSDQVMELTV